MSSLAPRRLGALNGRGLWTLYRRALQRHLHSAIQSVTGPAISGLLFLAVFVLANAAPQEAVWPGVSFAAFVAPGLIAYTAFHGAFEGVASATVYDKMLGMFNDLLAAPLTALELLLGLITSSMTCGLINASFMAVCFLPFVPLQIVDLGQLVLFTILGACLFSLLGLLVGLWARKWDHYTVAETFLVLPLGLLSGTFFTAEALPEGARFLLHANPVFMAIDGFRAAMLGHADANLLTSALILCGLNLALLFFAWRLIKSGYNIKA